MAMTDRLTTIFAGKLSSCTTVAQWLCYQSLIVVYWQLVDRTSPRKPGPVPTDKCALCNDGIPPELHQCSAELRSLWFGYTVPQEFMKYII